MFMQILHHHRWTEWVESYANKHPWSHAKTLDRYCHDCGEREYKILELLCPKQKKTGEYCHWCKGYAKEWDGRSIDYPQHEAYDDSMEQEKRKAKMGRPSKLARNIAMAIEYEFYPKLGVRGVGAKYGLKDPRTAWEGINIGRRYINLEKVKEAVG